MRTSACLGSDVPFLMGGGSVPLIGRRAGALAAAGGAPAVAPPEGWAYRWDASDLSAAGDGNAVTALAWGDELPLSRTGSPVWHESGLDGNPSVEFAGAEYFEGGNADPVIAHPFVMLVAASFPDSSGRYIADCDGSGLEWYVDHYTGAPRVAGGFTANAGGGIHTFPGGPHDDGVPRVFVLKAAGPDTVTHVAGGGSRAKTANPGQYGFDPGLFTIGSWSGHSSSFVGHIGEVLVYPAADLPAADALVTDLLAYAGEKYPSAA